MKVFDATDAIAGRLASYSAKCAMKGEDIVIGNCGKAVISGNPKGIIARFKVKRGMQDKANPEHSPKFPRRPDLFFKKMVKGMLPKKTLTGKLAAKRIMVYRDMPENFKAAAKPFGKTGAKLQVTATSIDDICFGLGFKG